MTNVSYKCDRCTKIFNHKNDYRRHINRVRKCPILPVFEEITPPPKNTDFAHLVQTNNNAIL